MMAGTILTALLVAAAALASPNDRGCPGHLVLIVPLNSSQSQFASKLTSELRVRVEKQPDNGWEVQVFRRHRGHVHGNLLYPERWHGAFPCQVVPWGNEDLFPNPRIIPIRSSTKSICVMVIDPTAEGEGFRRDFTAGKLEIWW